MISRPFDEILPEHISGSWRVKSSTLTPQEEYFRLGTATTHHFFENGQYEIKGSDPATGTWRLERNEEIIPNPIVYFELSEPRTLESAMITRSAYMPYSTAKHDEMILYFSNGCELVLEKLPDAEPNQQKPQ